MIIGEPKIGKSSFGAGAPDVVFVPTEDGIAALNVASVPSDGKCETWDDVLAALRSLLTSEHSYRWCAIDSLNEAERLCSRMVCDRDFGGRWNSGAGKEGFNAYGKGELAVAEELRAMLALIDQLQQKRGMGILLLTHVGLHKQGNALGADFQKFGGRMGKNSWALVAGWADQIGHACRDVRATTRDGETKAKASAIGNERWIVFEGGPERDAGTRAGYEMPSRILLSWDEYAKQLGADPVDGLAAQALDLVAQVPDNIRDQVRQKLGGDVTAEALKKIGKSKLETLIGWLLAWSRKQVE